MTADFKLSPELEGKFEVVNTTLSALHSRIGYVDFRTMTLEQAEAMVEAGTDYLIRVPSKKSRNAV
jgi:hypothetical protein